MYMCGIDIYMYMEIDHATIKKLELSRAHTPRALWLTRTVTVMTPHVVLVRCAHEQNAHGLL